MSLSVGAVAVPSPGRAPVELREYGPARDVQMSGQTAAAIARSGLVEARPTEMPGTWSLVPRGRVGAVHAGGVSVHVAPKVPIARLMFLLEYAPERLRWQRETVDLDEHADLLQVIATVFARTADTATRGGLLQGYVTVEESLPVVRGRIREADQMRLRQGRLLPVEVRYDEFTVDIPENQLLQAAIRRLLRLPTVPPGTRRRLLQLSQLLAEVSPVVRGAAPPRWTPSRLNIRYQPALRLAELILAGSSFEHQQGSLPVHGFVLNLPAIFEDFLTKALRVSLESGYGGRILGQRPVHLDNAQLIRTVPDIIWMTGRQPLAVIDAKYKAERPDGFPDADLYQALAYAIALDLPEAHLVYAKGNEPARSYRVRHAGVRITAHTLRLDAPPAELLGQVTGLAERVAESATAASNGGLHGHAPYRRIMNREQSFSTQR